MDSEAYIKTYEKIKRDVAARVDEWFQRDPKHWRRKAKEIFEQCQRYELDRSGPYKMGARTLHPVLRCFEWTVQEAPKCGELKAPEQGEDLLTYYAACIILHDYDVADPKWTSISGDLWLNCGLGIKQEDGLPGMASIAFFLPLGNKARLLAQALKAVCDDLNATLVNRGEHNIAEDHVPPEVSDLDAGQERSGETAGGVDCARMNRSDSPSAKYDFGKLLAELDRDIEALFDGCNTPEAVDSANDQADAIVAARGYEWCPSQQQAWLRDNYHSGKIPVLARRAKARIAQEERERAEKGKADTEAKPPSPDDEPEKQSETMGKGGGKRKLKREEANIEVRRVLKENPSWDWQVRSLAKKVECSTGTISNCPSWKAYKERRDQLDKEGTIKTVSLTDEMAAILGTGEKNEVLNQLIAEQEEDVQGDEKQAKLYLGHDKKPRRRED